MKITLLALLLFICYIVQAQVDSPSKDPKQDATKPLPTALNSTSANYQNDFSQLNADVRTKWQQLLQKAAQSAQSTKSIEALNYLTEAESIFANHPQLLAIKSFCYVQQQRLDLALETAKQAYNIDSTRYETIHNLAEVYFDLNQWQEAKLLYTKLLDFGSTPILEFKLDLIEIKLGNIKSVQSKLTHINPLDPQPYYFFLNYVLTCEAYPNNIEFKIALIQQIKSIYMYNPQILVHWFDKINNSGYEL